MGLLYKSTRSSRTATASEAILKGLSEDGGLFVPERIPALDKTPRELGQMSYGEVAYEVMKLFLTDFTEEELKSCIEGAYDEKFDTEVIAPLVEAEGVWFLELFHGKTIAFKDMALSILPYLMITAAKKNHVDREIVILTATSGDTGKAAMAGFADVPGTKIIVFYPKNGVSPIQERQMVTQKGDNVLVVGIHGNFDGRRAGASGIPVFFCQLHQHRSSASADRLLCICVCPASDGRKDWGRRADQRGGSHRKLREYPRRLLCEADGPSHRKADLRLQ